MNHHVLVFMASVLPCNIEAVQAGTKGSNTLYSTSSRVASAVQLCFCAIYNREHSITAKQMEAINEFQCCPVQISFLSTDSSILFLSVGLSRVQRNDLFDLLEYRVARNFTRRARDRSTRLQKKTIICLIHFFSFRLTISFDRPTASQEKQKKKYYHLPLLSLRDLTKRCHFSVLPSSLPASSLPMPTRCSCVSTQAKMKSPPMEGRTILCLKLVA